MNQCCGFEGSFNAEYFCRRCTLTSSECKCTSVEIPSKIRKVDDYKKEFRDQTHGVKEECVFNAIKNFHIIENPSADIMHDIDEGIAAYTIVGV